MPLNYFRGLFFTKDNMKGFALNKLSPKFYEDYAKTLFPELEHKENRPYVVLLIKIESNRFALPLRTHIKHNYCYKFKNTGRETDSFTGIDFTKAVVVNEDKYIGEEATIDDAEYLELSRKSFFIIEKFKKYLYGYIDFCKNGGNEYAKKKYKFSTLVYYHKELKM